MNYTEAYFIDHPFTGIGKVQYECPNCSAVEDDFKVWFKEDEIYNGGKVFFKCENCNHELYIKYDNFQYKVFVNE